VSAQTVELLDLIARWVHVVAGIMWVGNSLLFSWLDRSLQPPTGPGYTTKPVGTIWLLHSGGFYYVEKTLMAGMQVPRPLHWFKWQAYTTWLSGMALLLVVYYLSDRAMLTDPGVAGLSHGKASLIGAGSIAVGWLLYEMMQRTVAPRSPIVAVAIWVAGLVAIGVALTQLLSGRAAFLHAGAMLGTIMAGNVAMTIVPSQRELVASVAEGRGADAEVSARAKRVSIHNNYFAFPVVALMASNHYPAIYGHPYNWLMLLVIVAAGVAVRHALNIRFTFPRWKPALAATLAAGAAALYAMLRIGLPVGEVSASGASDPSAPASFAEVRHIIDRRCSSCHSARPSDLTFGAAPGGVVFDTPDQIVAHAARIRERAVVTRTMPPGNKTSVTDAERALLGQWISEGAKKQP